MKQRSFAIEKKQSAFIQGARAAKPAVKYTEITIRVTEEQRAWLGEMMAEERRPLTVIVRMLLEKAGAPPEPR